MMNMKSFFLKKDNRIEICFYLVIAVLPFTMILSPISLGLLALSIFFFSDKLGRKDQFRRNRILVLFLIYYFFQVIGIFYSPEYGLKYSRVASQLPLLAIPLLFVLAKLNLEYIKKAKTVFIFSCVLFCVLALLTLAYNYVVNYEHRLNYNFVQRSMYHFHYPYDVMYLNVANIFLLFSAFANQYKRWISLLFFIIIVLSGVRIGLFTYGLVVLVYGVLNFKQLYNVKTILYLVSITILGVFLINTSQYVNDKFYDSLDKFGLDTKEYVSEIGEDYHKMSVRNKIWSSSYEAFKKKMILGYGPKGSKEVLNTIYENKGYTQLKDFNSHNQYMTTSLNHGIIGLVLLLLIIIIALVKVYKTKNLQQFMVILTILIAFCTESVLLRQKGVTFFSIFFTLVFIETNLLQAQKQILTVDEVV
ncbi:O-antigen ligase family protein [Aquimarina sp. D1M17]|uniref:O-antigen ligase family protein n=1 Tax=Aquimarina acroporae TaxID=2937283 RepID=UPI0020BF03F8|nr:O-antigen ligase family protein [Aquimarina acroporae]MCK8523323.1 O-antigen ligase family protein [Aquimarina acroporae]